MFNQFPHPKTVCFQELLILKRHQYYPVRYCFVIWIKFSCSDWASIKANFSNISYWEILQLFSWANTMKVTTSFNDSLITQLKRLSSSHAVISHNFNSFNLSLHTVVVQQQFTKIEQLKEQSKKQKKTNKQKEKNSYSKGLKEMNLKWKS